MIESAQWADSMKKAGQEVRVVPGSGGRGAEFGTTETNILVQFRLILSFKKLHCKRLSSANFPVVIKKVGLN